MALIVLYDPGVYPFLPNVPFWSPWKHKKIKFYDVFREIKREHRKEKSYLENTSNYGFVKTGHFWLWKSEVWVWHLWVLVVRYRYDEKFTGSGLKKFCDKLFKISLVENSYNFVNVSIRRNSEWNWSETLSKKLIHFKFSIVRNKHTEITRLQALQRWFTSYQIKYRNCSTVKKTANQIT